MRKEGGIKIYAEQTISTGTAGLEGVDRGRFMLILLSSSNLATGDKMTGNAIFAVEIHYLIVWRSG